MSLSNLPPDEQIELLRQIDAENSLYSFVQFMWKFVEPANPFIGNWHLEVICEALEAVTSGEVTRLLINVPPGMCKSLLVDVFWPAWEWIHYPHLRYVCTSYSQSLTERDNIRFRNLIQSDLYRKLWGDRFAPSKDTFSVIKVANDKTGWKLATSVGGVGTGERGDRVIVDDPHNVKEGESEAVMESTLRYFTEVLPTRMTNPISSALVVIMQRVNEGDVSGHIMTNDIGYMVVMLPMKYDSGRPCDVDPRTEDGELIFPERFPEWVVERDEKIMGPYATASQFQQSPSPRGGGIVKREWWKLWPPIERGEGISAGGNLQNGSHGNGSVTTAVPAPLRYPMMDYIIASCDTAYTSKQENDYSACVVFGIFLQHGLPKVMLMEAWKERLEFHDLMTRIIKTCQKRKVDMLLIESKASGESIRQEIVRECGEVEFSVRGINPGSQDKVARMHAVVPLFSSGCVYAPDKQWAEEVINEVAVFPKGKYDDIPDCVSQGLSYLRKIGLALLAEEGQRVVNESLMFRGQEADEALYEGA